MLFFMQFLRFCYVKLNEANVMRTPRQIITSWRQHKIMRKNRSSVIRYLLTASEFNGGSVSQFLSNNNNNNNNNTYILTYSMGPASWSSGQRFWLLIMRSRVRISVLPWGFFLEGEDPLGDRCLGNLVEFRFKAPPGTSYSYITIHIMGTT
jgi:hypothetical protein